MSELSSLSEDAESQNNSNITSENLSGQSKSQIPLDRLSQAGQSSQTSRSTSPVRNKDTTSGRAQSLSPATILRLQGLQRPIGDRRRLRSIESSRLTPQHEGGSATHSLKSAGLGSGGRTSGFRSASYTKDVQDRKIHKAEGNSLESTLLDNVPDRHRRITVQGMYKSYLRVCYYLSIVS